MQPIIKWPGGKASEIQYIENIIPEYDRYIEPFVVEELYISTWNLKKQS